MKSIYTDLTVLYKKLHLTAFNRSAFFLESGAGNIQGTTSLVYPINNAVHIENITNEEFLLGVQSGYSMTQDKFRIRQCDELIELPSDMDKRPSNIDPRIHNSKVFVE
jgi:hypothetical protein